MIGLIRVVGLLFAALSFTAQSEMLTVPAGTRIAMILDETVSSQDNENGDRFRGRLAANVVVDGVAVARRGDDLIGQVIEARPAGRIFGKAGLSVAVESVVIDKRSYPLRSYPFDLDGERSGDLKKIAVKAALGGVLGGAEMARRMAMTGTAVSLITPGNQLELPHRAIVEFHSSEPVRMYGLSLRLNLDPRAIGNRYGEQMSKMMESLQRHQWEQRVEMRAEGEVVFSEHALVHMEHGQLVAKELAGSGEDKKIGIRGKLQKRKADKMEDLYASLTKLARSYAFLPPEKGVPFVQNAIWSPGFGGLAQSIALEGTDVLNEHDWVVLWIDAGTFTPRKMVLQAILGRTWHRWTSTSKSPRTARTIHRA